MSRDAPQGHVAKRTRFSESGKPGSRQLHSWRNGHFPCVGSQRGHRYGSGSDPVRSEDP